MFYKRPSNSDFKLIIDNMQTKLSGWKINCLNMARRIILAKASLSSIFNHVMKYIKLPIKTTKQIDRIQTNFIWGTTPNKKKMHLVNWEKLTNQKAHGGLGLHKAE